jgi:hypothetical protein
MTKTFQTNPVQEQHHQVRPVALISAPIFQGWGPKF